MAGTTKKPRPARPARKGRRRSTAASAEPMPSLIINNVRFDDLSRSSAPASTPRPRPAAASGPPPSALPASFTRYYNYSARRWMWAWVIIFSGAIIALWGWSLHLQIGSFSWDTSAEKKLFADSKNLWASAATVVDGTVPPPAPAETMAQLKTALANLMAQTEPAATTTTSTPALATSTLATTTLHSP